MAKHFAIIQLDNGEHKSPRFPCTITVRYQNAPIDKIGVDDSEHAVHLFQ